MPEQHIRIGKQVQTIKDVRFFAAGSCRCCSRTDPHYPHVAGWYSTVSNGELVEFCPGVAGGSVTFDVITKKHGIACRPAIFEASWQEHEAA